MKSKKQRYIVVGSREFVLETQSYFLKKNTGQSIEKISQNEYKVDINGELFSGEIVQKKQNRYSVSINGNTYHFRIDREESAKRRKARGGDECMDKTYCLKSPMPGKICEIFVSKGTEVKQGEPLLILEAMKMQNQILASEDSRVMSIHVKKNENVLSDQLLVELERLGI